MKQYGIIGLPLSHSFSPAYFSKKFAVEKKENTYDAFPIASITQLPNLIQINPKLLGLNVTIPYKTEVISYLDYISESAQKINAVNCIKIVEGKLYGYNTDFFGFAASLKPLLTKDKCRSLVLGTGGSSKAICYALLKMGIEYKSISVSGNGDWSYSDLTKNILQEHPLIINTTPLGMFPKTNACPNIPYQFLNEKHLLFDLIYNPEETLFLKKGKQQKAQIKNGMEMLILQAEKSWELWNDDNAVKEPIALK